MRMRLEMLLVGDPLPEGLVVRAPPGAGKRSSKDLVHCLLRNSRPCWRDARGLQHVTFSLGAKAQDAMATLSGNGDVMYSRRF